MAPPLPEMRTRRRLLQGMGLGAGLCVAGGLRLRATEAPDGPRFLIVLGCIGGASMLDCYMPVDGGEALTLADRGTVIGYDTRSPAGPVRCIDRETPLAFVNAWHEQTVVMGTMSGSVNPFTAQHRSVTGRGAWAGRTMAEAVASVQGVGRALPGTASRPRPRWPACACARGPRSPSP